MILYLHDICALPKLQFTFQKNITTIERLEKIDKVSKYLFSPLF